MKVRLVKSLSAWLVTGLGLLFFCSCSVRESSVMRLVPRESCAVITFDWPVVRMDPDLNRAIKGQQLDESLRRLGIGSETVKNIAVFASINTQQSGLLVRGKFDPKQIVVELKNRGWVEETLEGHKVYVKGADYVAIPATDTLFAGTQYGATAVFLAQSNSEESLVTSASYRKINASLSAAAKPIKAFLFLPQGTLDMADAALSTTSFALSFFQLGAVGQLLKTVNVAKGTGFVIGHAVKQRYPVELCLLMRDEPSAVFVSGTLNAMKAVTQIAAANEREQESLQVLRQMTVTRKQEVLALRMEIPGAALFPPLSP